MSFHVHLTSRGPFCKEVFHSRTKTWGSLASNPLGRNGCNFSRGYVGNLWCHLGFKIPLCFQILYVYQLLLNGEITLFHYVPWCSIVNISAKNKWYQERFSFLLFWGQKCQLAEKLPSPTVGTPKHPERFLIGDSSSSISYWSPAYIQGLVIFFCCGLGWWFSILSNPNRWYTHSPIVFPIMAPTKRDSAIPRTALQIFHHWKHQPEDCFSGTRVGRNTSPGESGTEHWYNPLTV